MQRKSWFSILQDLTWLTQFGLSVAASPVLALLAARWLDERFALGGWVYFAALILGFGASACTISGFMRHVQRRSKRGENNSDNKQN